MSKQGSILIIDDDRAICTSISLLLRRAGFTPHSVNGPRQVLEKVATIQPVLILLDMNFTIDTSGKQGLKLLKELTAKHSDIPVILMTGWATVDLAVRGMKAGARDFVAKPWDNKQLLSSIRTILTITEGKSDSKTLQITPDFDHIIGDTPAFQRVMELAKRISKTDASVLITGESGTGKEVIAEAIHYGSLRRENPFVKVNLGGISSSLFESEMFGHKKGAYTDAVADRAGRFELANTGTIFLDEIGDLELGSQVKLLRVLQEKTFEALGSSRTHKADVRVISATNKDLKKMVAEGTFREDLFYRINLIHLQIPPLRERPADIPLLVDYFIQNLREIYARPDLMVLREAKDWLSQQHFPGNIRQLKNLVERAVLMAPNDVLGETAFSEHLDRPDNAGDLLNIARTGNVSLEEMEVTMIRKAMLVHNNKVSRAARSLGLTRSALYRRLNKYNIPYDD